MITLKTGNIFTTQCQTIVNTVNCVGFMGAGIAFEFKLRYPEMFTMYQNLCEKKQINIGLLWIYHDRLLNKPYSKILNFPTKKHWKDVSKLDEIEQGLVKFVQTYQAKNITSIAFPLLGASLGGLSKKSVMQMMAYYLSQVNIPVEIWEYDPLAKDDMFDAFKAKFLLIEDARLKEFLGIRLPIIHKIRMALTSDNINAISGLLSVKGVGEASIEKIFQFVNCYSDAPRANENLSLF